MNGRSILRFLAPPPTLVPIALLVTSALIYINVLDPQLRHIATLEERFERQSSAPSTLREIANRRFLSSLPSPEQREHNISRLSETAQQRGLTVSQISIDASLTGDVEAPFSTLFGRTIVTGHYPALRSWLDEIHQTMPGLSITTLQAGSAQNGESTIQARLEFGFHASTDGGNPPPLSAARIDPPPIATNPFALVPAPLRAPPTPATEQPAPPPPQPYTYGGSLRTGRLVTYLLIEGDQTFRALIGDTLPGGRYRLESASPEQLELVHLPSGYRHHISTSPNKP